MARIIVAGAHIKRKRAHPKGVTPLRVVLAVDLHRNGCATLTITDGFDNSRSAVMLSRAQLGELVGQLVAHSPGGTQ